MKSNKSLINIEKNKDSNINIVINEVDDLSYDNIRKNYKDIVSLEENYSDRLEFGKDVLTKKLLPKQLQSDFEIVPKYNGNRFEFETKAITSDAYEKFPLRITYKMQFNDIEEAKKFRENGLNKLIEEADRTGKAVEIPNITSIKEFIGEYEDPVGYANKHGSEGIKLYVCPTPLPPSQKYKIDIFNSIGSFSIETVLRLKNRDRDKIILTNDESESEPFNIAIILDNIKKEDDGISGKFTINISLREKYKNNCEYCKEIIKYQFLVDDSDNHIQVNNVDLNTNVFSFDNCGNIVHKKKDYNYFNRLLNLIDKVIFIAKVKGINIDFDLDYFLKNEDVINLLYSEINNKKYKSKKRLTFDIELPLDEESEIFCNQKEKFWVTSELKYIDLFGKRIDLKSNSIMMKNCSIIDFSKDCEKYVVKIESTDIEFKVEK